MVRLCITHEARSWSVYEPITNYLHCFRHPERSEVESRDLLPLT